MNAMKHSAGRYLQALVMGKGRPELAALYAESQGQWIDRPAIVSALKAAVAGAVSGDFSGARSTIADAFLEAMRGDSVPLRLAMRRVPMRTRVYVNTAGVLAVQVAEGGPIPVLKGTWTTTTLTPKKHAGIVVQTLELAKATDPGAPLALSGDLAAAVADAENLAFCSPWVTGSVFDGSTMIDETGTTAAHVGADMARLVELVAGVQRGGTWLMHPNTAAYLGGLGCAGNPAFVDVGPMGGKIMGMPALVTDAMAQVGSPDSRAIGLVSPQEIFWADGGVELTTSTEAALEMTDAATGNSATGTAGTTSLVSMFQADAVATRAIRESSWYKRTGASAWLTVSY